MGIKFTERPPKMHFTARPPTITFTGKTPRILFSKASTSIKVLVDEQGRYIVTEDGQYIRVG